MFCARHNHVARNRVRRKEREQVQQSRARGGLLFNLLKRNLPRRRDSRGIIGRGRTVEQFALMRAIELQILGKRLAVRFDVRARLLQREW